MNNATAPTSDPGDRAERPTVPDRQTITAQGAALLLDLMTVVGVWEHRGWWHRAASALNPDRSADGPSLEGIAGRRRRGPAPWVPVLARHARAIVAHGLRLRVRTVDPLPNGDLTDTARVLRTAGDHVRAARRYLVGGDE